MGIRCLNVWVWPARVLTYRTNENVAMLRYLCSRFKLIKSNRPWEQTCTCKHVHIVGTCLLKLMSNRQPVYLHQWGLLHHWGQMRVFTAKKRCLGVPFLEEWLYIWLTWWTTLHTICWVHLECCCLNCWKKMRSAALPDVAWLLCNTIP